MRRHAAAGPKGGAPPACALAACALAACALAACPLDPNALPELEHALAVEDTWPTAPLAPPPQAGEVRAYLTNNLDDTVTLVDLGALARGEDALLAHVPVGFVPVEREGPHHVTADAAGEFYYVGISNFVPGSGSGPHGQHGAGDADGHILKLRVDDDTQVAAVRIDRNPGDVRLTPDGTKLLATHFDMLRVIEAAQQGITAGPELDSSLAIVDPVAMTREALVPACPAAHGIGITADSAKAVMSCASDEVAIVDLASHDVTRVAVIDEPGTAQQPVCFPYAVTMDGGTAWVSCFNGGGLVAVDVDAGARDGRTAQLLGAFAMFGEVRDGVMAIAHQEADGVSFFDATEAGLALRSFKLFAREECLLPHVAKWSDDGAHVYVVCEGDKSTPGALLALDAAPPHAILGRAPAGLFPDDIAVVRR